MVLVLTLGTEDSFASAVHSSRNNPTITAEPAEFSSEVKDSKVPLPRNLQNYGLWTSVCLGSIFGRCIRIFSSRKRILKHFQGTLNSIHG
jgi:hypothetical protein